MEECMKHRPLQKLSDFVVEEMPVVLAQSPAQLPEASKHLAALVPETVVTEAMHERRGLALLDVTMLEAGIVHSGHTAPRELTALVERIAGDEYPVLTYENIVLINPGEDLRTFTAGEVGAVEKSFYRQHWFVEDRLLAATRAVISTLDKLDEGDCAGAAIELRAVPPCLIAVRNATDMLRGMPKEHFQAFRKYLGVHPVRDLKGPSGAFTARIPALEFALRGDELPSSYRQYIEDNWLYLPRRDRAILRRILNESTQGRTLEKAYRKNGSPKELTSPLNALSDFFLEFRKVHLRAVGKHIPEALNDATLGTAGEKPGTFLRERLAHSRRADKQQDGGTND